MSDPTRRTARAGSNPPGAAASGSRAGRRERARPAYRGDSFIERHRTQLLIGGTVLAVALIIGFLYVGATQKTYACSSLVDPATATAGPSGSPRLGQQEKDMGNSHIPPGAFQRYTYCPPASGNHYNVPRGPIPARYYGPDEGTEPQGWVHNLEHGALVVLYNCSGGCPDDATLQKLKSFAASFPASPICNLPAGRIGPVITRFDDMKSKFAALVWDRLLMLDSADTDQVLTFFRTEGERTNPEKQCAAPSPAAEPSSQPSALPGGSAQPSGATGPSGSPAAGPSGSPAASPSS